jgi:hypothetical protein
MGRIRRARKLIRRDLAVPEGEVVDHLGIARLIIIWAKCELVDGYTIKAAESLQNAWGWLEALAQSFDDEESLRQAKGVLFAYVTWWATEAKRRQMAGEGVSDIDALRHAIEKARLCYDPHGWRESWHDLTLMNLLLRVADAYDRHELSEEASKSRNEAEEIFAKRRFPESARWPRYGERDSRSFAFLRKLRRVFGRG